MFNSNEDISNSIDSISIPQFNQLYYLELNREISNSDKDICNSIADMYTSAIKNIYLEVNRDISNSNKDI